MPESRGFHCRCTAAIVVGLLAAVSARPRAEPHDSSASHAARSPPMAFVAARSSSWLRGPRHAAVSTGQPARVAGAAIRMEADLYATLGIARGASEKDIKNAYRQAARKYHPDVNPSEDAKAKFQTINEAYSVLSDQEMRQRYDQFGMAGVKGMGGGPGGPGMQDFDLGDIFESFFGGAGGPQGGPRRRSGPMPGEDLRFDLEIDFQTALFGGQKKIRINQLEACDTCSGSGVAPGASVKTCSTCGGKGVVVQVVNTILGRMQQQSRCPTCGGTGTVVEKYCGSCDGKGVLKRSKKLNVNIPPGVQDGNRLRIRGEGDAGPKGGPSGDLYVFLKVEADPRFRREGMDIYADTSVSYVDAILGSVLRIPTVDGEVDLNLPAGTQPGTTLRIEGKGAPKLNNANMRGSHFVKVKVEIPKRISNAERDLVLKLKEVDGK